MGNRGTNRGGPQVVTHTAPFHANVREAAKAQPELPPNPMQQVERGLAVRRVARTSVACNVRWAEIDASSVRVVPTR